MRINFALILWRRMIEFPPAQLALPKHQSMTICSPCSSTLPSSLHLPTTVRPNTLWTKILNVSKTILTGYSFWDWFQNFLHKFTWIVLPFISSGKSMDNCWILCHVMADMENFYHVQNWWNYLIHYIQQKCFKVW